MLREARGRGQSSHVPLMSANQRGMDLPTRLPACGVRAATMLASTHDCTSDWTHRAQLLPSAIGRGNRPCFTRLYTCARLRPTMTKTSRRRRSLSPRLWTTALASAAASPSAALASACRCCRRPRTGGVEAGAWGVLTGDGMAMPPGVHRCGSSMVPPRPQMSPGREGRCRPFAGIVSPAVRWRCGDSAGVVVVYL